MSRAKPKVALIMTRTQLFVADDKFADVIRELEGRNGWRRFPHIDFPKFDLKWSNYRKIVWSRVDPQQIVNHFQFATLWSCKDAFTARLYRLQQEYLNGEHPLRQSSLSNSGVVDTFFPRTFAVDTENTRMQLARCVLYSRAVGILKTASSSEQQLDGSIDDEAVRSALAFLLLVLQHHRTSGVRIGTQTFLFDCNPMDRQWEPLRRTFEGRGSNSSKPEQPAWSKDQIDDLLQALQTIDVQLHTIAPGYGNLWICKPSNLSQGRGIQILSSLDEIQALISGSHADLLVSEKVSKDGAPMQPLWIVQKYIESPLLLPSPRPRKFDVRQWVLITSLDPLRVYWYDECYLRVCSEPFSLDSHRLDDPFTHLSNYSIQKYFVSPEPNEGTELMWSSSRFQHYLKQEHGKDIWQETIIPQMLHAVHLAIASVAPELKTVGRGFEWLGFDFLVDVTHRVWLLEVNVTPDVSHSTPVTAALVPRATRDTLDLILNGDTISSTSQNGWCLLPSFS